MKREFGIDLDAAKRSRERAKEHNTDAYYDEQAHILAQWVDKNPPKNLILGELPVVSPKHIRFDID